MRSLLVLLVPLTVLAGKKDDVVVEKFESGKTRSRTVYKGNDLLEAEAFFENGKIRLTTKRAGKSEKGYGPDTYTLKEMDDDGRVVAEGSCSGPPLEPIDPYEISKKPKLHYGTSNCSKMTGIQRTYSDKNGLISEIPYKEGYFEGEATYFKDNIVSKVTYVKGAKVKLLETDKASGKILKSEEYYADGSKK